MNAHFHRRLKEYIQISNHLLYFQLYAIRNIFFYVLQHNIAPIAILRTCKYTNELIERKKKVCELGKTVKETKPHFPKQVD